LWKGGGNVHGPQPRDWSYTLPRKKRWKAIATAFAERIREGAVVVVDDLNLPSHKTKLFRSKLCALGLLDRHKVLILDSTENRNLLLASRNLEGVKLINSLGLNIYDLLLHEKILISQRALTALTECLTRILRGTVMVGKMKIYEVIKSPLVSEKALNLRDQALNVGQLIVFASQ
jgi:large subunit ribosomal protein L4